MASALPLFVFETLGRDLAVEADELAHQRLVFRMFRSQPLHAGRIRQHGLEEVQVVAVELFAALDLFLEIQRLGQADVVEALQQHLDGAGLLDGGVAHGFSRGVCMDRYLSTAISRLCNMPSRPSVWPSGARFTVASTCELISTSHSDTPDSRRRFSASVSIFNAEYSRSTTPCMSMATTFGLASAINAAIFSATSSALRKKMRPSSRSNSRPGYDSSSG